MSYLEKVKTCHRADLSQYLPFYIETTRLGWIKPAFVAHLKKWQQVFVCESDRVSLNPTLSTYQQRSEAVAPIFQGLHQQGVIDTWVGEAYPVTVDYDLPALMEIERAAAYYMGINSYGVHVNGLVKKAGQTYVWVATRARDKPFFPGKLDQIVAGGQPVGVGILDNVIKEAKEEADMPARIATTAQAHGRLDYCMDISRGLEIAGIYVYDVWLPADFVPKNTDGEVDSFELISLEKLSELTAHTDLFKTNCNLLNIDLLLRLGVITEAHADYVAITKQLYYSPLLDK